MYGITKAKYNTTNITNSVTYADDGFINIRKAPLWFVRSGTIYSGGLLNTARYGVYWSSTVSDGGSAPSSILAALASGRPTSTAGILVCGTLYRALEYTP